MLVEIKEGGREREGKRERDLRTALASETLSTHRALSIWKLSKRIRYKLITFMSELLNISSPMLWLPLLRYVSFQSFFAQTVSMYLLVEIWKAPGTVAHLRLFSRTVLCDLPLEKVVLFKQLVF